MPMTPNYTYCNGAFIEFALVVPTLDLTVVSIGRVAGFPYYNTEYPLQLVRARTARTLLLARLVTKRAKTLSSFNLFIYSCNVKDKRDLLYEAVKQ